MTPTPPAIALQESVAAIDGQSATLVRSASVISGSNDPGMPQQVAMVAEVVEVAAVAAVADGKQEWEIHDIIGKEVVDGEVHYLVEWSATLVPKCELGEAKVFGG